MSTVAQVATRARGEDFDAGLQSNFETFVTDAIADIFRTTNLARGGMLVTAATAVGSNAITGLSTTVGASIQAIFVGDNGDELDELDWLEFERLLLTAPSQTGRPQAFGRMPTSPVVEAPTVLIWPKANAIYSLLVAGSNAPIATDLESADPVPIPTLYEKLLTYYARSEQFDLDGDIEMATRFQEKWETGCARMRGDLQRRNHNRRVPGTWARRSAAPVFHRPGLF